MKKWAASGKRGKGNIMVLLAALLSGSGAITTGANASVPEAWKDTPYSYTAENTPLEHVLDDFAQTFGVSPHFNSDVTGTVAGSLSNDNAVTLLDRLARQFHFQWFVYNNALYVSPAEDRTSARIDVSTDEVTDLKQALTDIGLLDERFGWGEIPDQGVVLVTGPQEYVNLVKQFVSDHKRSNNNAGEHRDNKEVMAFSLRYAQAGDRQVHYRDQSLTIPGIASIFNTLLAPKNKAPQQFSSFNNQQNSGSLNSGGGSENPLQGGASNALAQGVIDQQDPKYRDELSGLAGQDDNRDIRVTADVRNNTVLIYDDPSRRSLYRHLIDQLDVPKDVVSIDAVIVDIDRNKMGALASNWSVESGDFSAGGSMIPQGSSSTVFIQDYNNFFSRLRALEGEGKASVIANPSILTVDNQPAVIDLSQTEYLQTVGERVAEVSPITAGTMLRVIPHVVRPHTDSVKMADDNSIQLDVNVEDGKLDKSEISDDAPKVDSATISTLGVIGEKRSLVVGGFESNESTQKRHRVPILGYIPILGKLFFSSNESTSNNRERLFILTPRVLGNQVDPAQYLPPSQRWGVNHALNKIKQRQDGNSVQRNDIRSALAEFAAGRVPPGFKQSLSPDDAQNFCYSNKDIKVQPQRAQLYESTQFDVGVTVVRNTSDDRKRIDELSCNGKGTLAVAAWPHAWLEPGQQTEIFVARRHSQPLPPGTTVRRSLLSGGDAGRQHEGEVQ